MVLLVRDAGGAVQKKDFLAGLEDSFKSTFVVEGRWRLILQGLGITILISVCSGICGLSLGGLWSGAAADGQLSQRTDE